VGTEGGGVAGVMATRRGRRPAGSGVQLTFEVIAETLREQIHSGRLRPGDALPPQAVLMREFGSSSLTVQKAMTVLKQEGWAVSRPGKGAFVAHQDQAGADDLDHPEVTAPVGGMAARVEALEQALAEAVEQLAELRARVAVLEAGNDEPGR
jgi:DNA-binding GntR family transcriptional regulator